jgi:hypothetical protein
MLQIALIGCASNGTVPLPAETSTTNPQIVTLLYDQYNNWRGVRYREGGLSKNGVDCSGYVHLTYKQKLRRTIPRSNREAKSVSGRCSRATWYFSKPDGKPTTSEFTLTMANSCMPPQVGE